MYVVFFYCLQSGECCLVDNSSLTCLCVTYFQNVLPHRHVLGSDMALREIK